jgi:hypothetical protein
VFTLVVYDAGVRAAHAAAVVDALHFSGDEVRVVRNAQSSVHLKAQYV